jgi:hypothetical protein
VTRYVCETACFYAGRLWTAGEAAEFTCLPPEHFVVCEPAAPAGQRGAGEDKGEDAGTKKPHDRRSKLPHSGKSRNGKLTDEQVSNAPGMARCSTGLSSGRAPKQT